MLHIAFPKLIHGFNPIGFAGGYVLTSLPAVDRLITAAILLQHMRKLVS